MMLGSHNSWSYLKPLQWWLRPFAFMARCQNVSIEEQYEKYGVRCFDLRVRFKGSQLIVAHGYAEYDITENQLFRDICFLSNRKCTLRILLECRSKKPSEAVIQSFINFCLYLENNYSGLRLWCGRSLYDWSVVYDFNYKPTCLEKYGSVSSFKWLYGWMPRLYAKFYNRKNLTKGTDCDILLIDYVNIN